MLKRISIAMALLLSAQVAVAGPAPRVKRPPSPIVKVTKTKPASHLKIVETIRANGTATTDRYFVERGKEPVLTYTMQSWQLKSGVTKKWAGDKRGDSGSTSTFLKSGIERVDSKQFGPKKMHINVKHSVQGRALAMARFAAKQTKPFTAFVDDRAFDYRPGSMRRIFFIHIAPGDSANVIEDKMDTASLREFGVVQPRD